MSSKKALIFYYSGSGNTKKMAKAILSKEKYGFEFTKWFDSGYSIGAAVPEPSTMLPLVSELIGLAGYGGRGSLRGKSIFEFRGKMQGQKWLCLLFISFGNHQLQGQPPIAE